MFRMGRMGKIMIAAQIGMKLFRMARAAKARSDEKRMMAIDPHKFTQGGSGGDNQSLNPPRYGEVASRRMTAGLP